MSYCCGGDKLTTNQDTALPAASLTETKILVNSTISDAHKGEKFMASDLKDFFLATPMDRNEYMKIHIKNIPQDIIACVMFGFTMLSVHNVI